MKVLCPRCTTTSPPSPASSSPSTATASNGLPCRPSGALADDLAPPEVSESDGFAEQQDDTAPGVGFCVEDEKAVDGAGLPVGHLGAGVFQWEGVVFDAAQRSAQVGNHLLRPDDPDRAGS